MIVEYTLEANGTIPTYIADGGYFSKVNDNASPQDLDLVGHTVNDDVPETVTVLNKAALITRLTNLSIRHLLEDRLLTAEEIETAADNFISKHD
tara:strand:- start:217 stop:498 length:282 start_codon:yes stop_codon:yes gene_type:complete